MRSAVLPNRSRVASCIVESLLPGGDRTRRALLVDLREQAADLGARRQAELVAAHQRLGRIVSPGLLYRGCQLGGAHGGERVERPELRRATEAVDRARVGGRPL